MGSACAFDAMFAGGFMSLLANPVECIECRGFIQVPARAMNHSKLLYSMSVL